jgi:hypothetical protein
MLSPIFEKFAEKSPISIMARGMMERVLNPGQLDQWFNETAEEQYTKFLRRERNESTTLKGLGVRLNMEEGCQGASAFGLQPSVFNLNSYGIF